MSKLIGITGGIGSGKTTLANHLVKLGYPVYFADKEAKRISESEAITSQIVNQFGSFILVNGAIDRAALAEMVFKDPKALKKLNQIIHPAVAKDFQEWLDRNSTYPIVFKEAAILFESGSYKYCDAVITITAPKEERIKRVAQRDRLSTDEIENRMARQWSDEDKIKLSNYVIVNENLEKAIQELESILKKLNNSHF
jgi:dephospho-CoA kinase